MPVSDALDVHVGERSPTWWDQVEAIRRTENPRAWGNKERPVITMPDLGWASLALTPRWVGDDSSESVVAIEPSRFHGEGADEWKRLVLGTRSRGELALAVKLIGDVKPPVYRAGGSPSASVTLPINSGHIVTSVGGERLMLSSPPELATDLQGADRDLALRISQRSLELPWWNLHLTAQLLDRQSSGIAAKPSGTLSPLLLSRAGEVVASVWTGPEDSLRYYILPFLPSYKSVLQWLSERAIPEYVPSAARRRRSFLSSEPALQTWEEASSRSALDQLEADFERRRSELRAKLDSATAEADSVRDPILYGSGSALVDAVEDVLRSAGMDVVNLDELFNDTISADLLAFKGQHRILVEVKSASGNPSESLVDDTLRHLATWPALRPELPVEGIVLVLNHQTRLNPLDRPNEPYARPEFVQSLKIPVITTRRLFDWWQAGDAAEIVAAVFGA